MGGTMNRPETLTGNEAPEGGESSQHVLASLRLAYPRGHAALQQAVAGRPLGDLADIEVHADRLCLVPSGAGDPREVPFDIAGITPRGGFFDVLLDHDRHTVLAVAEPDPAAAGNSETDQAA